MFGLGSAKCLQPLLNPPLTSFHPFWLLLPSSPFQNLAGETGSCGWIFWFIMLLEVPIPQRDLHVRSMDASVVESIVDNGGRTTSSPQASQRRARRSGL